MKKKEVMLTAPKSFIILFIQYLSIAPLGTVITILFVISTSCVSSSFSDILLICLVFILPLLLIIFSMLYFPQRYKTLVIFDIEKSVLHKINKGKEIQSFNIGTNNSIVSKTIRTSLGLRYNLILEDTISNSHIIFNENTPFGAGNWEIFSKELSTTIDLTLKKECWVENQNGTLSLISKV